MIGLVQRVSSANVVVDGQVVGQIARGLLVLVGIERGDEEPQAERLLHRVLGYRLFADLEGRMNRSLTDIGGELLLVPQFTLAADTGKGMRPGFNRAADPATGRSLFEFFVTRARKRHPAVQTGMFGANMQVSLINDGPVTFWLQTTAGDEVSQAGSS